MEHENKETESYTIDEWDGRGDEIIKMAESHPINNSTGKKSMLWNLKRKKLQEKKIKEEIAEAVAGAIAAAAAARTAALAEVSAREAAQNAIAVEQATSQSIARLIRNSDNRAGRNVQPVLT